jgi:GGDEF domain-containing protein
VVAPSIDREALAQLGNRLVESVKAAGAGLELEGIELGASAGCALIPEDVHTVDEALALADRALRQAKVSGKGRLVDGGVVGAGNVTA